jgi:hypothetical protein
LALNGGNIQAFSSGMHCAIPQFMHCRRRLATFLTALVGVAMLGTAMPAAADVSVTGGSADFSRVLSEGVNWVAKRTDAKNDARSTRAEGDAQAAGATTYGDSAERRPPIVLLPPSRLSPTPARPEKLVSPLKKNKGPLALLVPSLVARDWNGSFAVVGKDLASDNIRLTRSSRMLVSRLTLGDGKIKPFAHFAVGEWRYDPYLLPLMPRNQEYATQFSGGLAIELFKHTSFVWEADYTVLVRSTREPQNLPSPHVLGTFAILETRL